MIEATAPASLVEHQRDLGVPLVAGGWWLVAGGWWLVARLFDNVFPDALPAWNCLPGRLLRLLEFSNS